MDNNYNISKAVAELVEERQLRSPGERYTKFLNMYLPGENNYYRVEEDQNQNFEKIDGALENAQKMAIDLFSKKQDKTDNSLQTADKTVAGAINENKSNIDSNKKNTDAAINELNIRRVDTIEQLKASDVKISDVVEVLGYYEKSDGATHKRVIASEDDGSGVELANGLWANILHNGEVNVSWFGAKGDGVTDDTLAIQKALFLGGEFPEEIIDKNKIYDLRNKENLIVTFSKKVYKTTQTLFIPSNVTTNFNSNYFSTNNKSCIYYTGAKEYPAVSTLLYALRNGKYVRYREYKEKFSGKDADDGKYITCCKNSVINLCVIVDPGTELGVLWINAPGCRCDYMGIGENVADKSTGKTPLLALLVANSWGCHLENVRTLSYSQGIHFYGANGGTELSNAYVDRPGSLNTNEEKQIFKIGELDGSTGISIDGSEIVLKTPTVEHWYLPFVCGNKANVSIYNSHVETYGGIERCIYYAINDTSLNVYSPVLGGNNETGSTFYLENETENNCSINCYGATGTKVGKILVDGVNSGAVLTIDCITSIQMIYGQVGNWNMINELCLNQNYSYVIYISTKGDDRNYGTMKERPVKTLKKALQIFTKLKNGFTENYITFLDEYTLESDVTLQNTALDSYSFGGEQLNLNSNKIILKDKDCSLTFFNKISSTSQYFVLYNTNLNLRLLGGATGSYALLLFKAGRPSTCNLEIETGDYSGFSFIADCDYTSTIMGTVTGNINLPKEKSPKKLGVKGVNVVVNSNIVSLEKLNTPYMATKMQERGIYKDFIDYMDEEREFEKAQQKIEEQQTNPRTRSLKLAAIPLEEPKPSPKLEEFIKEFL